MKPVERSVLNCSSTFRIAAVCLALAMSGSMAAELPRVVVSSDDTVIRASCEISIPAGTIVADANTNGVLHVAADNITIRFAPGSELRGAPAGSPWNELHGVGIRIDGHRGVKIQGARVHGFFNGLVATRADGLIVNGGDFSDNYRQRLRSTPQAEDGADWLFPHNNDERKWRDEYGGAVCIEASRDVTVRGVRVRRGQNGIVLDRVEDSRIYDNDCSFLSGWGLALWRSSRNVVSRNAFDFCVRGHVEGVYNRGQDSAGILCFEQCNENRFVENSVTHGGDGFFGFAGREALGEFWMEAQRQRLRRETGRQEVDDLIRVPPEVARDFSARGCNRNILVGNDLSYAPAHGIEMTFSEGNVIANNRLVENAICGVWGGYSSDTLIIENEIAGNGGMAYGLERGGINMEHAAGNRILRNRFRNNKCAVHLWWDNDAALLKSPGVAGNYRGVSSNVVAGNSFVVGNDHPFRNLRPGDRLIGLQLRDDGTNNVHDNLYVANEVRLDSTNAVEFAVKAGCEPLRTGELPPFEWPRFDVLGTNRPVGARAHLRGRDKIVMNEWGPWDHESPLVRPAPGSTGELAFDIFGVAAESRIEIRRGGITARIAPQPSPANAWRLSLKSPAGVMAYEVRIVAPGLDQILNGTIVGASWNATFFPWKPDVDPREKLDAWRRLAGSPDAVRIETAALDFPYGWGGPRDQLAAGAARERLPGGDHFGMIARTRLRLPQGGWRFVTLSDDGVRVTVNGAKVLENWGWHGPTRDEGTFHQAADGEVEIVVEHFEIDGYAVLRLDVESAPERPGAVRSEK